jgi:hypothetical protein
MLRGQDRRQWHGTYDLHFNHHDSVRELQESAIHHCGICRSIYQELCTKLAGEKPSENCPLAITACLSVIPNFDPIRLYRLDFKIRYDALRCQRTFILKKISTFL